MFLPIFIRFKSIEQVKLGIWSLNLLTYCAEIITIKDGKGRKIDRGTFVNYCNKLQSYLAVCVIIDFTIFLYIQKFDRTTRKLNLIVGGGVEDYSMPEEPAWGVGQELRDVVYDWKVLDWILCSNLRHFVDGTYVGNN